MACLGGLSGPALSLPVEVLEVVLSQLPHNFLITTCATVCRHWYTVIRNPAFLPWKKLYHRYKHSPSSQCSSLLLHHSGCGGGGGDEGDSGGDGGDGGGDMVTASHVVRRLSHHHHITTLSNCLINIIRAVGRSHGIPWGTTATLLEGHRLYWLAQDTLAHLDPTLLPRPHNLWHVTATIVTLSHDVWDVHQLICLLLQPGSLLSPCGVVEALYSMAVLFLHATSPPIGLPMRYHYQVFYALYLYENDWGGRVQGEARQEQHTGQQSMQRYVQRRSALRYTHEQLRIINHPLEAHHVVKIVAFAGTGKTTTLLQLCKRRPDQRFLLVVFNKSVQEHCCRTFPNNTQVKTAHSLAFAAVGRRYQAIHKFSMSLTSSSLSEFLPKREGSGNRLRRVAQVRRTLERFLNSSDEHLTLTHVPTEDKNREPLDDDLRLQVILPDAELVWAEMSKCSRGQALHMTQDGQLKVWQLSRPVLSGYDVVMMDEGQDMNPSMLDVFLRQPCAKVIVGDPHQQIYSFRGAVNAMESVASTHTFYLTQSFRFGPEVSFTAQCLLDTFIKTQKQTLVGGHKQDTITAALPEGKTLSPDGRNSTAYLGRNNLEVYRTALHMCQQKEYASLTMAFAGGLHKYGLDTLLDIYKLWQVQMKKGTAQSLGIKNKLVAKFESVSALKHFTDLLDDMELYNKVLMFELSGSNTPRHIQLLKDRCSSPPNSAQVVFSTIHKAKGLEWDHVVLLSSPLSNLLAHFRDQSQVQLPRDEINLLYVSVTRAKKYLTLNSAMMEVLRMAKERREVLVAGRDVEEGSLCVQCKAAVDGKQPLVTKVLGVLVMEMGSLRGGYLCHHCSTHPLKDGARNECSQLVLALQPRQDYPRTARLQLVLGRPLEDT